MSATIERDVLLSVLKNKCGTTQYQLMFCDNDLHGAIGGNRRVTFVIKDVITDTYYTAPATRNPFTGFNVGTADEIVLQEVAGLNR